MKRHHQKSSQGPSQRQLRVGELVRRALADMMIRGDHFEPELEGKIISVSEVRTSPDLRVATAFVYSHGGDTKEVIAALSRIKGQLRNQIGKAVHLKYVPELRFLADQSFDYAERTEELINQVAGSDSSREE